MDNCSPFQCILINLINLENKNSTLDFKIKNNNYKIYNLMVNIFQNKKTGNDKQTISSK